MMIVNKQSTISMIVAMAENRVIGRNGAIPWDLSADRKHFRELTMGHPLILGRMTFESIGRALPGRKIIVITRQRDFRAEGCLVAHDLQTALAMAEGAEEVFIGGGGDIYREAMPLADRIYLTLVHGEYDGDAYFPEIPADFRQIQRQDATDPFPHSFILYQRSADRQ